MEKIKKYNQILLAIGGTVAVLLLLGAGLFALVEFWSYNFRDYADSYDTSIVSEEVTDSLALTLQVRTQVISLNEFSVLDSVKAIYILPVGQKNLGEEEDIDDALLGLSNSGYSRRKDSRRSYGANYNNLILFAPHLNDPHALFDNKVAINFFSPFNIEDKDYIFIRLADFDSNEDGVLNANDNQRLYLYDLENSSFLDIEVRENTSFISIAQGVSSKELIFKYGEDRNQNGEFEKRYEPTSYYRLDIETGKMELLLPVEMLEELQNTLEGSADGG